MRGELDTWWLEQARRPSRYQLWRAPRGRPTVLLDASDDADWIAEHARNRAPCVVVDTFTRRWPLRIDSEGQERGPWGDDEPTTVDRLIAAAEALRTLPEGEHVRRRLGLTSAAARRAAEALRAGVVWFRGKAHPLPGGAVDLRVEFEGPHLVVRRVGPGRPRRRPTAQLSLADNRSRSR